MASIKVLGALLVAALTFSIVVSTSVKPCKGQRHGKMMAVNISSCQVAPCILKKNTTATVQITFIPQTDVKLLRTHVYARLVGLPVPFIGVDGKISCDNLYLTDGQTKVGCPLKADTQYVYKNSFDIHSFYPSVSPLVHWALQDVDNDNDVVCFEIQSKISA